MFEVDRVVVPQSLKLSTSMNSNNEQDIGHWYASKNKAYSQVLVPKFGLLEIIVRIFLPLW